MSTLDELDRREEKERAELARIEASVANLSKASSFLKSPFINLAAFKGLPESFWASIGVLIDSLRVAALNTNNTPLAS